MNHRREKILRKSRGELLGVALATLSWILNIAGISTPLLSIFGVVLGFVLAGYSIYRKYYEYEERIDTLENSKPRLFPSPICGVFSVNPLVINNYRYFAEQIAEQDDAVYGTPGIGETPNTFELDYEKDNQSWFALVTFHNKPFASTENSVAREVSATITYYDKECKLKLDGRGISGRWWSNPEIIRSEKSRRELERTDIYPGPQGVILALACMGTKDSAIYAYNNENHYAKDFKKQDFALGLQGYNIHVVLAGVHLEETEFWFYVWRDTGSEELKIIQIDKPDCIR